jgi:hypothetical protein
VAAGSIGPAQLDALARALEHPEVRRRTAVILQHHPVHNPQSRVKAALEGLADAAEEMRLLQRLDRGLLLHGHLHRRIHRRLETGRGHVDAVGATSASLVHHSDERMAGFNLYDLADDGAIEAISSHRLLGDDRTFREVAIPRG